jgi:hypothetical protein
MLPVVGMRALVPAMAIAMILTNLSRVIAFWHDFEGRTGI